MKIKDLADFLLQQKIKLKGCSVYEVSQLESYFDKSLPIVYKEYLYAMGKDAGKFMLGSSAFYNDLYNLREDCEEMLSDHGLTLPDDTFVFGHIKDINLHFFMLIRKTIHQFIFIMKVMLQ